MYNQSQRIRNYEREANHARNEAAQEERHQNTGNRMSVAKHCTGKKYLYVFLLPTMRTDFMTRHGRKYNEHNPIDQAEMTKIFHEYKFTPDETQKAKRDAALAEIDAHNKDKKKVKEKKRAIDRERREQRHKNPDVFRQQRTEHVSNLQSQTRITTNIPSKIEEVISDEDASRFCGTNKNKIELSIPAFIRSVPRGVGNPICSPDFKVQVISIFPALIMHKEFIGRLICFPAEVAVTTFDLICGVVSSESMFVEFDSRWAYGDTTSGDHENDRQAIEEEGFDEAMKILGEIIGSNKLSRNDQEDPFDVYDWLMRKLNEFPSAKLVSSQLHFRYVYNGLKLLANYHGLNGMSYFAENIASRLVPIEDLTDVLLEEAPFDNSSTLSDNYVRERFQDRDLVPLADKASYCEFHDNLGTHTKYNCMKAQNARLIHIFFRIMEERRLQNFVRSPCHHICIIDPSSKPNLLQDLSILRAKKPNDQNQVPHAIHTPEEDAAPDDGSDEEYYSDDDDDDDDNDPYMINRHHQTNNTMSPHLPRQDVMSINNSQRVQNYMVYSSDNYDHQEEYYNNWDYPYDMRHDDSHHEHHPQRHHNERYDTGPSNTRYGENDDGWSRRDNMGFGMSHRPSQNHNWVPAHFSGPIPNENRSLPYNNGSNETWNDHPYSRYGVPQQNNTTTSRGTGAPHNSNGGSRIVGHSPDRSHQLENGRQHDNQTLSQDPAQVATAQRTPYIEYPTPVEFETPTFSNYNFNAEECNSYFKTAKKNSAKAFTIINLQSVH